MSAPFPTVPTPMLIAIEGLDASGKSTQAGLLAHSLQQRGFSVGQWSFPRYDSFFGTRVGALLSGSEPVTAASLDPRSMALWFAMDRWDAIRDGLPTTDVVILNRWTLSNAVYQGARAADDVEADAVFDWVLQLETGTLRLPLPTLTVLLDISVETSMDRAVARAAQSGQKPDVYESKAALLIASKRLYQRAANAGNGTLLEVDNRTVEQVQADIDVLVSQTIPTGIL
jgi:dTMP kinase